VLAPDRECIVVEPPDVIDGSGNVIPSAQVAVAPRARVQDDLTRKDIQVPRPDILTDFFKRWLTYRVVGRQRRVVEDV
jgi:hypothetical protein